MCAIRAIPAALIALKSGSDRRTPPRRVLASSATRARARYLGQIQYSPGDDKRDYAQAG
jgi:hypothetical protein